MRGNVTGAFLDLPDFNAKSLQILREAVPTLAKAAVLWNPASGSLQLEAVGFFNRNSFYSSLNHVARPSVKKAWENVGIQ